MAVTNNGQHRITEKNPEQRSSETVSLTRLLSGNDEDLLTVREVAAGCRVDDTTVRRWIKSGVLEALALPHRGRRCAYRVRRGELRRILTPGQLNSTSMEMPRQTDSVQVVL